jgi:hypothetical protein
MHVFQLPENVLIVERFSDTLAREQKIHQSQQPENFMKPEDNRANMKNSNKGTPGVNTQNAQNQGNRGKQKNPIPNNSQPHAKPMTQKAKK